MFKHAMLALPPALAATLSAHAALVTVNFESDAPGPVANGFMSFDSPFVTFSDSDGSDLSIGNFGIASDGQSLMVGQNDTSALIMNFSTIVDSLSIDFGNDDPNLSEPGDFATLTLFLGNVFVGEAFVELNRNTAMDQTISFSGAAFDNATIEYYVSSDGVAKTFDNFVFNTVPGPGGLGLMALVGLAARRRRS